MSRRNFIKAYNDMLSGSAQSNVGGLTISEFGNSGAFPREVEAISRQSSMKIPNTEKAYPSRYVVNTKSSHVPISPTRNVQVGVGLDTITQKNRNLFVDIDGEAFPSEELDYKGIEGDEGIDTAHKVQRHISLVDLARPYVPKAPARSAMVRETREKKEIVHNEEPIRTKTLPKGFSASDQPYVLPKFTPTFKEMLSTRSKKDTLVSITESTPPSMQKWAVEWNSEPKHSISIAELKDDIMRETIARNPPNPGNNKNIIFAEEEHKSFNDDRPKEKGELYQTVLKSSYSEGPQHRFKSGTGTERYYAHQSEPSGTYMDLTQCEQKLKQIEAKSVEGKPSLDWLLEKREGMERTFKGIPKEPYSFRDAIREKANDDQQQKSNSLNKEFPLQGETDVEFSFDENRKQFHQWFRSRLSRADKDDANGTKNTLAGRPIGEGSNNPFYAIGIDPYSDRKVGLKSVTYSEGDPTRSKLQEKLSNNVNNRTEEFVKSSENTTDCLPPKEDVGEPPKQYSSEKNSSFYYWLKQRGLLNVMKSRTIERQKPARIEEVVKPEPKFPWSTSYVRKYVPGSSSNKKLRNDSKKELVGGCKSCHGAISVRKAVTQNNVLKNKKKKKSVRKIASSHGNMDKTEPKKPSFAQEKSTVKKNKLGSPDSRRDGHSENVPYYGWVVSNELDHVKNLRSMENYHAAPEVMNRKKLFPSLLDQMSTSSLNYWESKYTKPLTKPQPDDLYNKRERARVGSDEVPSRPLKKFGSTVNATKVTNIFGDKNFINISDDPIMMLNKPEEPTSLDINRGSRADDDASKISQYAVKLSQKIGEKLSGGHHTLIAKQRTSKIGDKNSPIHLQFSRNLGSKSDGGRGKLQDSLQIDKEDGLSVRDLETDGNDADEEWIHMISPKNFNLDNDGDLIHLLKQSGSEFKPSSTSPNQS